MVSYGSDEKKYICVFHPLTMQKIPWSQDISVFYYKIMQKDIKLKIE